MAATTIHADYLGRNNVFNHRFKICILSGKHRKFVLIFDYIVKHITILRWVKLDSYITTLLQAPESMKAVIMAISLMTNAIGNAITLLLTLAFEHVFDVDELV